MRALVLPADLGACGHYRLIWPSMVVADSDYRRVSIVEPGVVQMRTTRSWLGTAGFEVRGLPDLDGVDVVVMQRVGTRNGVSLIRYLQERGVAVVLDADDALWAIDRDNKSWKAWNTPTERRGATHWAFMDEAARLADLVTVTTPALADRYGAHGRVEVIPNYLPEAAVVEEDALDARLAREGAPRLGWAGTLDTHPRDPQEAAHAVSAAITAGAEIHVIGDGVGLSEAWGVPPEEITVHGTVGLADYHEALDVLDVGLVPLEDNRFNRAKSWLKALEYAGRGIPSIVSPAPANRALRDEVGAGYDTLLRVAHTPEQWAGAATSFVKSPTRRYVVGHLLRAHVAERLTIEANVERWTSAWDRAVTRRRNLARRAA